MNKKCKTCSVIDSHGRTILAALTLCQPINKEKPKSEPKQKFCTCEEYQKGINAINGSIQMAWIHGVTPTQLTPFNYCPWCGNKIKKG